MDIREDFPSLFLDSDSTKRLREQAQKPYKRADYFTFFTYRKLSIYVSNFCVKKGVGATPVTYASIVSFLMAMGVGLTQDKVVAFTLMPALWHLGYFLDVVDGEIARINKRTSVSGAILDKYIFLLCVISYYFLLGTSDLLGSNQYFVIIIFGLLALDVYFNVDGATSGQSAQPVSELKAICLLLLKLPFIKPGVVIIYPVLAMLAEIEVANIYLVGVLGVQLLWSGRKLVLQVRESR